MTWVNLKQIEHYLETIVVRLVNRAGPEEGCTKVDIERRLVTWAGQHISTLRAECPGWFHLAGKKRGHRLNKIIEKLIREQRIKRVKTSQGTRLVPLDIFDRLIKALSDDVFEEEPHSSPEGGDRA